MKTGQCVELRFSTAENRPRGIVTRVGADGRFRVSYPPDRRNLRKGWPDQPSRFWYPRSSAQHFRVIG